MARNTWPSPLQRQRERAGNCVVAVEVGGEEEWKLLPSKPFHSTPGNQVATVVCPPDLGGLPGAGRGAGGQGVRVGGKMARSELRPTD